MTFLIILKILSILISIISNFFILPIITALIYGEKSIIFSFVVPLILSWIFCAIIHFFTRKIKISLSTKQTFLIVALAWISTSLFGAIPFFLSGTIPNFTDAFFESVSGFSTTGATVLTNLESCPKSILLWRCLSQWLGGMGIIALTVALLPILGVGGFQLIKAETTGPEKGKVTPKITTTAKVLWAIYVFLTILETILLMIFKMDFFDALCHSFSTLGAGGFSTRTLNAQSFASCGIDIVLTIFMFLSGINFSLYYYLFSKRFKDFFDNSELKAYIFTILFFILAISFCILPNYKNFFEALRYSSFNVLSIMSTAGFINTDYTLWSNSAQFLLFLLFFVGGCSGSTAGGIKIIRFVILAKKLKIDLKKMIHPRGVFTLRINKHPARSELHSSVATFLFVYILLILISSAICTFCGFDSFTAFTSSVSMIGNVGSAFGNFGPTFNFSEISPILKWWFSFLMLTGRLELFTMIIFFLPDYWKK